MPRRKKDPVNNPHDLNSYQSKLSDKAKQALIDGRVKAVEELVLEEELENAKTKKDRMVAGAKLSQIRKRIFTSTDDFLSCWNAFVDDVRSGGYELVPTYLAFAEWCDAYPSTVYDFIKTHSGVASRCAESMADCLVEGCMKKNYQNAITIFTLKNRCGWADKREDTTIHTEKQVATAGEAKNKVLELIRNDRDAQEAAKYKAIDDDKVMESDG